MTLLVGGLLTLTASLPPEHGHADRLGRPTVVHRHASFHVVPRLSHVALRSTEVLEIRIESAFLVSTPPTFDRLEAALTERAPVDPERRRASRVLRAGNDVGIHDPPSRPSAPRPPPV